ncbi:MAG: mevalonate kinase [Anaerolineaceae bacterium]|nr:mevalonate kinase [Anaerolineaceae bacterium]
MKKVKESAPAKAILFGEHAVVYGHPAIAVPINHLRAYAVIQENIKSSSINIHAEDIGLEDALDKLPVHHPIRKTIDLFSSYTHRDIPPITIQIRSDIPIAGGLGSGAAITIAILHALSTYFLHPLTDLEISNLAFEVEKIHHSTPSGIDNTVIAFEKPTWFIKGEEIKPFDIHNRIELLIANSNLSTPTAETVNSVREQIENFPIETNSILENIGNLTWAAKDAIAQGNINLIGDLMAQNHQLLKSLNVSCERLDQMVETALSAGAFGAKLSGGGRGGNIIALINAKNRDTVFDALRAIGITEIFLTTIEN